MGSHRSLRLLAAASMVIGCLVATSSFASARVEPDPELNVLVAGDRNANDFEIAYNPERNEYFAVWMDLELFNPLGYFGQRLASDGSPIGAPIEVAAPDVEGDTGTTLHTPSRPRVAYNAATDQYVVVYGRGAIGVPFDPDNRGSKIVGQLVSDEGVLFGSETDLNLPLGDTLFCSAQNPDIVADPSTGGYVLTYVRQYTSLTPGANCGGLEAGRAISSVQVLDGGLGRGSLVDFPGQRNNVETPRPRIAYNPVTSQFLVTVSVNAPESTLAESHQFESQIYDSSLNTVSQLRRIDNAPTTATSGGVPTESIPAADPVTGEWFVVSRARFSGPAWMNSLSPSGASTGTGTRLLSTGVAQSVAPVGDGTFVFSSSDGAITHVRRNGTVIHRREPLIGSVARANVIAMGANGRGVAVGFGPTDIATVGFGVVAPGALPVSPARVLETRTGEGLTTSDGLFLGDGPVAGGQVKVLQVAGRGGTPSDAAAVNLNVTAARSDAGGFVTVFPCDAERPNTSNLNYQQGRAASAAAFARLSAAGTVCLYTSSTAELIVDVNGYVPLGGSVEPLVPARLLDTRPAGRTDDGLSQAEGRVAAGSITTLKVTDRGGVAGDADAVIVNATAVNPSANAFLTVFPCDEDRPGASNLNAAAGANVNNLVIAKVSATGTICVFSSAETDLLVDVAAYVPAAGGLLSIVPARLLESRVGAVTVDGLNQLGSPVAAESVTTLRVAGRGSIAADATGAVLNVAAIRPSDGGFITAYPCDAGERPQASNVNFAAGAVVSNAVVVKLSATGTVCIYTNAGTNLAVDVVGYSVDSEQ